MSATTRIKCCGMTRVEDARLAADLGVDAIGLVFAARSPRGISAVHAHEIATSMPPFVSTVALFMDADADFIHAVIDFVRPDLLQFHGSETDGWCAQFGQRYIKAIAMGAGMVALPQLGAYPGACALLLDGHAPGATGGAGAAFDWSLIPSTLRQPLILAGGLTVENVAAAVRAVRPWAVDVASGIESTPGAKDPDKLARFVAAVREASFDD